MDKCSGRNITCYNCNRVGHKKEFCTSKLRAVSEQTEGESDEPDREPYYEHLIKQRYSDDEELGHNRAV